MVRIPRSVRALAVAAIVVAVALGCLAQVF
ncbi:hypothetical protein J2S55_001809 [Streptosporangium brasiliense]|uniref:Uncharacterized protein n=1 Tax=Streptosporangium brasiliense TaxID=47480 RepID=A0ABT9QZY4_9ACTN|nr:hypothetical protein [Streptosporangium brasiliense]